MIIAAYEMNMRTTETKQQVSVREECDGDGVESDAVKLIYIHKTHTHVNPVVVVWLDSFEWVIEEARHHARLRNSGRFPVIAPN